MQQLVIAGTVGKDAELRRTQGGDSVLGFSVAVDTGKDSSGNKRPAVWYDASIWGKRADALQGYITKGTKLTLQGRPTARAHNEKAHLGISVDNLTFQGGNPSPQQSTTHNNSGYGAGGRDLEDEIPF
jgi:single-strand DNA-binding protein